MNKIGTARAAALLALVVTAGCSFHVHGDDGGAGGDDLATSGDDLATSGDDLATSGDDLAMATPPDMAMPAPPDMAMPVADMTVVSGMLAGSKAAGPSTVDLTTEGTSDWFHLGLTAASDVDRKSRNGGSQLAETTNGTLGQYTMYQTTFSWSDGTPTASATNTPNGAYVLGVGKSFTVTAPADTTMRTLRLYLNVGGGASLTAHLSDGSAADYTDTQTGPINGAIWLYTFRYSAASAGKTLTVTWTLTSGTGVSLVAATLQ